MFARPLKKKKVFQLGHWDWNGTIFAETHIGHGLYAVMETLFGLNDLE